MIQTCYSINPTHPHQLTNKTVCLCIPNLYKSNLASSDSSVASKHGAVHVASVGNVAQDIASVRGEHTENTDALHANGGVPDDTDTPNDAHILDLGVYPGLPGAEQPSMDTDATFGDSGSPSESDNVPIQAGEA